MITKQLFTIVAAKKKPWQILPTKFPLTIFREVRALSKDYINKDSVGIHWTTEPGYAESYNDSSYPGHNERKSFLLRTKVNKEHINWKETKNRRNHPIYGQEREIVLKRRNTHQIHIDGTKDKFHGKI